MSERCSFTSEYIHNQNDYKILREIFDKEQNKYVCTAPPAQWADNEMPVIQGKTAGGCEDLVWMNVETLLEGVKTEYPVRFIVMADNPTQDHVSAYILDKSPSGEVERHEILESYVRLDGYDKRELENKNYNLEKDDE